jgi:hypothetical protein
MTVPSFRDMGHNGSGRGRYERTAEFRRKASEARRGQGKGRKLSRQTRERMKAAQRLRRETEMMAETWRLLDEADKLLGPDR